MTPLAGADDGSSRGPFRVLMICTANQCRSPMAAFLLRHAIDQLELDWVVESAGTNVREGTSIHPVIREVLAEQNLEIGSHRARQVDIEAIAAADLILTADVGHRQSIVATDVRALNKAFPLRQFARFAAAVDLQSENPATLGADLVTGARMARSRFQPTGPGGDDINDPIGGKVRQFRACRDAVSAAVDQFIVPLANSAALRSTSALTASAVPQTGDDPLAAGASTRSRRRPLDCAPLPRRS